ncbi:hypothetical protein C5E45_11050 [Nocardia nova]|uniref:Uncharacterized protein n=1 Tax=Nocardia nova TaxID=37330 RepID=A0A2S6ASP3_9NOCA|nr:hypothetical protein [Nocardia nova]PPJ30141.1 hypothetical protein C5E41_09485 [Nocardia nova]PPJ38271.1 hypothetical protein C5E45_11050 [Nocardia nova]
MTDPANARFGEPHTAREGHRLTRSEEESGQQTGSSGRAHGGAEKFGLRWDGAEFGDSSPGATPSALPSRSTAESSGEGVFGPPAGGTPTDIPSDSPEYLTGGAVPAPPPAPPLPVRDTSAGRNGIPPLPTREPAQRSMFASPFDADYEQSAAEPVDYRTAPADESGPTSSFAVTAAEMPAVDPGSGALATPAGPGAAAEATPEKPAWDIELDAAAHDPEDTVRRIAESLGIDPGLQRRSRTGTSADSKPTDASPSGRPDPQRSGAAEPDASPTASVPVPPKLPMRLPAPAEGLARTEPAGTATEPGAAGATASTEPTATSAAPVSDGEPRSAAAAGDDEAATGLAKSAGDSAQTLVATRADDGHRTAFAAATGSMANNERQTTPPSPTEPAAGDTRPTTTDAAADGEQRTPRITQADSAADSVGLAAKHTVAESDSEMGTVAEESEQPSPAARLPHRHSNEPAVSDRADTTNPTHSDTTDGTPRADSSHAESWQDTDTFPALRSRTAGTPSVPRPRPFPARNGAKVALRSAPASTVAELSDTDIVHRTATNDSAAHAVPISRHRSPTNGRRIDDVSARNESRETAAPQSDPATDAAHVESSTTDPRIGGRRSRRAAADPPAGDRPEDIASRAGLAPTSRRAARRRAETPGEPPAIDVGLVMQLLLASHTLENVARNAEAGDLDLNGLITAAHRTRTAAVELVTTWFGGADQMREFAEALLAATEP